MVSKALKRKIADKFGFKLTKNYYRRYGFDNQQDFWNYAKEVNDIDKEIVREEKQREKYVSKLTNSIFRNVVRKIQREAPKYSYTDKRVYKTFTITNSNHTRKMYRAPDIKRFIISKKAIVENIIKENLGNGIKINCGLYFRTITKTQLEEHCRNQNHSSWFSNYNDNGIVSTDLLNYLDTQTEQRQSYSRVIQLLPTSNIKDYIKRVADTFANDIAEFVEGESGQVIYKIEKLVVRIYKATALTGSSYIDLPEVIKNKKACINPKNDDDKCSMYAVKASLFHDRIKYSPERVSNLMKIDDPLDYSMLKFPTPLTGWDKFEKVNKIAVNVYSYNEKFNIYVLRTSKLNFENGFKVVNLLFIAGSCPRTTEEGVQGDGELCKNHYVSIKNMSALLCNQENRKHAKKYYCPCCLNSFFKESKYKEHIELNCQSNEPVRTIFPVKDDDKETDKVFFKNTQNQLKCPFVIYADYETLQDESGAQYLSKNAKKGSSTYLYSKHTEESVRYLMLYNGEVFAYKCFSGVDCSVRFIEALHNDYEKAIEILNKDVGMKITSEEQASFENATLCHVCDKELHNDRVRDHCHLTGKYRGPAHNKCNLKHSFKNFKIPCFFHNFKGYDAQLVLNGINKFSKDKVNCIAQNTEKFITFTLNNKITFKDSLAFLSSSLDKLAKNLDENSFKQLKKRFGDKWKLMKEKGIMCYEYLTCDDKLNDTELPPKSAFYSSLTGEDISDDDYTRAKTVWNAFECKTLRDYYHLYLEQDVCLLADIFEEFRDIAMKRYKLDPAWYFTLPGFAWDCMLILTCVVLHLITDPNMYLMVENGIRGGISCINHRHAKANNPYLSDFDKDKLMSYIIYKDANNLYGWAMSQYLPEKDFEWDEPNRFDVNEIMKLKDDGDVGYIFEVDLEYPHELHDKHNQYPLAVERKKVKKNQLSNYQLEILTRTKTTTGNTEKLIGSLDDKKNYVVHYRNLKFYLQQGLKLTKVHRVVKFKQSPWLKKYIDLNTGFRQEAKSEFEKDFYKLMNNAVFGKTMENVRNRIDFKFGTDDKYTIKYMRKFNFKGVVEFPNENITGLLMGKTDIKMNKPIAVGFSILDVSKLHMYKYHYEHILKKYDYRDVKLLFTDTDSFCYLINTNDIYDDMIQDKSLYDLSNYNSQHKCYDKTNGKVLGKFKDETAGEPIVEFVGLKPKMYSFKTETEEKKVCKGTKKSVVKKFINYDLYKQIVMGHNDKYYHMNEMNTIRSLKHQLCSVRINKVSLCAFDDKRYILDDGINTLAHGHYLTL